eukprot:Gb_11025 [translate_table: standard]
MSIFLSALCLSTVTFSGSLSCRTQLEGRTLVSDEHFFLHRVLGALEYPTETSFRHCNWKRMHSFVWNRNIGFKLEILIEKRNKKQEDKKGVFCSSNEVVGAVYKEGKLEEMGIFHLTDQRGFSADSNMYDRLLQGCIDLKSLAEGKIVHFHMLKSGFDRDIYLENRLISMYAKCGSIKDARQVFDKMTDRNVVSWNVIIGGYTENGFGMEALSMFGEMLVGGIKPNRFTFISVLRACASLREIEQGKQVHTRILKARCEMHVSVANGLLTMYANCGRIDDANTVFITTERNLVSWNRMITGYVQNGLGMDAFKLFGEMQQAGVKPDLYTFASALSSCASVESLEEGEQVHSHIIKTGFGFNVAVENALITMYAKCRNLENARKVFDRMPKRDVVSWNAMIAGYAQNGHGEDVLKLICRMQLAGLKLKFMLNEFTFASVLSACASLTVGERGKEVHAHVIKTGFVSNVFVGSALVDMYSKCGSIEDACMMFNEMPEHNLVSWNAMIGGYAQNGCAEESLTCFRQMEQEVMKPNQFTFASVLRACASLTALEHGKQVHAHIIKTGFEFDVFVGTALVDVYAKCESIEAAIKVFGTMPVRNLVTWNTMIAGYVQNGHDEEALILFCQMQQACIIPDQFNLASILGACAGLAVFGYGSQIHAHIVKNGFESDGWVGSALVDMYDECGSMVDAFKVFNETLERDIVSWTAMIAACARHGHGKEALQFFEQMKLAGMKPDHITFVGVLCACSHLGLLNKGRQYFQSMSQDYGITPRMEHYACMVDLLGHAGCLVEAEEFIKEMPFEAGAMVWRALLGASRVHGNVDLVKHGAENILEMEPEDFSTYVLLSNIYTADGRWKDVARVRELIKERGVKKESGCSWIEVKGRVHMFVARDISHPQTDKIYARLKGLTRQMEEEGYVPNTHFLLHDVEDEQNEEHLCYHSEKLAIAFGLISIPPGAPIRIVKNLRVCSDCHTTTKFISKLVGREIILKNLNCFHHFKDGKCSCQDYW